MTTVHYIVGEPGVGKSWIVDRLTEGYHRVPRGPRPRYEDLYETHEPPQTATLRAIELGARRGPHPDGYPGTDAMSMTAIVDVHRWLVSRDDAIRPQVPVLGEGARLGVQRLVQACAEGDHLLHVHLIINPDRAAAQRAARGSMQNESWIKGARTRAENFAHRAQVQNHVALSEYIAEDPEVIIKELRRATGL